MFAGQLIRQVRHYFLVKEPIPDQAFEHRLAGQPVDLPRATSLQTVSPAEAFRHTRHERATSESSGDATVFASVNIASGERVIVVDPTSREQQKLS